MDLSETSSISVHRGVIKQLEIDTADNSRGCHPPQSLPVCAILNPQAKCQKPSIMMRTNSVQAVVYWSIHQKVFCLNLYIVVYFEIEELGVETSCCLKL